MLRPRPNMPPVLVIGSLLLAMGSIALRSLIGRRGDTRSIGKAPPALPKLRNAIVGNSKTAVASIFGPPRIATFNGPGSSNYLDADTWYYPLRPREQIGMVIRFDADKADAVDFFPAPRDVR